MLFKAVRTWVQLLLLLLCTSMAFAEPDTIQPQPPQPEFSQQELDQMLAPIALYPDALLSQILMAATYPLEVVEAARWSKAHPALKGDQAVKASGKNDWDPSVISLTAFPQILVMMDEKLNWTERLGDAFLAQQPQVMDTVQNLRQKAIEAGNLRSNDQIRVEPQGQTIVIMQAAPQIVYVPYYDPTVVYGPWWWDAYPPVYWDPWPGYYYRPGFSVGFYWGSGIAVSSGFFFGNCDWPHRRVNIVNVNNYYINNYYTTHYYSKPANRSRTFDATRNFGAPVAWQHDPDHRHGVPYQQPALQQQFSRASTAAETRHDELRGQNPSLRGAANLSVPRPDRSATPRNRPDAQSTVQPRDTNPEVRSNVTERPSRRNVPDNSHAEIRSPATPPATPFPSAPSVQSTPIIRTMPQQRSHAPENAESRPDARSASDHGHYNRQEPAPNSRDAATRTPEHADQQQPAGAKPKPNGNAHHDDGEKAL